MSRKPILRAVIAACAVALGYAVAAPTLAQKPASAPPELFRVNMVTLKHGMGPQYTQFQINEVMPALKKGGLPARHVFSSGAFGDGNRFSAFVPISDFATYDAAGPLVKALSEQGAAEQTAKLGTMVESQRFLLLRRRTDLSYIPDPKAPPAPISVVSEVEITPGKRAEFESLIRKEVVPVMQQAKVRGYSVFELVIGGNVGTYFTAIGYDSYAAVGKGHPFEIVLGPGGPQKMEARFAGVVQRLERSIVQYRPELSFTAGSGTSN